METRVLLLCAKEPEIEERPAADLPIVCLGRHEHSKRLPFVFCHNKGFSQNY